MKPRAYPRPKVVGKIVPEGLYTTEGVERFTGLGRESLTLARRSGMVKAYERVAIGV